MAKRAKAAGRRRKIRARSFEKWTLWSVELTANGCTVRAFKESTGLWQTIAGIAGSRNTILDIIKMVELLNRKTGDAQLMRSVFEVLQTLEEESLTFATEMELEHVIERLEERGAET